MKTVTLEVRRPEESMAEFGRPGKQENLSGRRVSALQLLKFFGRCCLPSDGNF
jgi:hypothetical protein